MKVRRGNTIVRYYETRNGQYVQWQVCWSEAGKRKRSKFGSKAEAEKEATKIAERINLGQVRFLTARETDDYQFFQRELPGVSMSDLVAYWKRGHAGVEQKPTAEIVREMIDSKRLAGRSETYLQRMEWYCAKLAEWFPRLPDATAAEIERRLEKFSPVHRNDFRKRLSILAEFAQSKGYLSREWSELDRVPVATARHKGIEILTPDKLREIFRVCRPNYRLYFAIAAFTGIRPAEILRLEWSHIGPDYIEVPAARAKTASRRLVPVQPNLTQWLATIPLTPGPVVPRNSQAVKSMLWMLKKKVAGISQNILRHSYISYRLAATQDAAKTALEAGNTPQVIFRHYRELVTPQQAEDWFSICPQSVPTEPKEVSQSVGK